MQTFCINPGEREAGYEGEKRIHFYFVSREEGAPPFFFPSHLSTPYSFLFLATTPKPADPHAAALLEAATGRKTYTLDTWLLSRRANLEAFWRGALLDQSQSSSGSSSNGDTTTTTTTDGGSGESGEPSSSSSSASSSSRRYVDVVLVDGGGGPLDGAEPSPRTGGDGKGPKGKKSSTADADDADADAANDEEDENGSDGGNTRPPGRSRLRQESHRSLITEVGGAAAARAGRSAAAKTTRKERKEKSDLGAG